MFDQITPNNQPDMPKPVEDIFGNADKANPENIVKPAAFQPKTPGSDLDSPETADYGKKYFVLGILILLAVFIVGGGYYGFTKMAKITPSTNLNMEDKKISETPVNQNDINKNNANQPVMNNDEKDSTATTSMPSPIDSDQDGLTDEEEANTYHTNPNNIDSDGDGLFDREEVKVYRTDPNKPDTDGDGYKDGDEVRSGYNPNGPGKLYEIKK